MTEAPRRFVELIATITGSIGDGDITASLGERLTAAFPPEGDTFRQIESLCRLGRSEGWLCAREAGGIRFGRPVKPGDATHGFSVDVVEMADIEGPHHVHPAGEIDMVMPIDPGATFDGAGRGWKVYRPGSAHRPAVHGGKALVLYLLPGGAIEFTRG